NRTPAMVLSPLRQRERVHPRGTTRRWVLLVAAQARPAPLDVTFQLVQVDDAVAVPVGGAGQAVHDGAGEEARFRRGVSIPRQFIARRSENYHHTPVGIGPCWRLDVESNPLGDEGRS